VRHSVFSAVLLVGVATVSIGAEARDTPEKPVFSFALVADTHLGCQRGAMARVMERAIDEINASPAEFTLFVGDLVNAGTKPENETFYPQWLEIVKRLKNPFHAVPGNHDPPDIFTKHIQPKTDTTFDHKGYRFICFNDTRTDSHLGFVTPEQLAWIRGLVEDAAEKGLRVILVAHVIYHKNLHPDVGWWIRDPNGGKEFGALLREKGGTVVAFFAAHFHCGMRGWDDTAGIHEVVIPALAYNSNRRLEKAPGWALDDFRPGYAIADVYADALVLKYKPLGGPVKASKRLELKKPVPSVSQ